jgi:tetratricopeptide (TPR) repeat protein
VLLALGIGAQTWKRNTLWADEVALFESDFSKGNHDSVLLGYLAGIQLEARNEGRVLELCDAFLEQASRSFSMDLSCGIVYARSDRPDEAEKAFLMAIRLPGSGWPAYRRLASLYLRQGRPGEAEALLDRAVQEESDPALKAFKRGYMLMTLFRDDPEAQRQATREFRRALELNPRLHIVRSWLPRLERATSEAQ